MRRGRRRARIGIFASPPDCVTRRHCRPYPCTPTDWPRSARRARCTRRSSQACRPCPCRRCDRHRAAHNAPAGTYARRATSGPLGGDNGAGARGDPRGLRLPRRNSQHATVRTACSNPDRPTAVSRTPHGDRRLRPLAALRFCAAKLGTRRADSCCIRRRAARALAPSASAGTEPLTAHRGIRHRSRAAHRRARATRRAPGFEPEFRRHGTMPVRVRSTPRARIDARRRARARVCAAATPRVAQSRSFAAAVLPARAFARGRARCARWRWRRIAHELAPVEASSARIAPANRAAARYFRGLSPAVRQRARIALLAFCSVEAIAALVPGSWATASGGFSSSTRGLDAVDWRRRDAIHRARVATERPDHTRSMPRRSARAAPHNAGRQPDILARLSTAGTASSARDTPALAEATRGRFSSSAFAVAPASGLFRRQRRSRPARASTPRDASSEWTQFAVAFLGGCRGCRDRHAVAQLAARLPGLMYHAAARALPSV